MSPQVLTLIFKLIDLAAVGLSSIPKAKRDYDELSSRIQTMVAEGRDPTPREFERLMTRAEDAHSRIQNAK